MAENQLTPYYIRWKDASHRLIPVMDHFSIRVTYPVEQQMSGTREAAPDPFDDPSLLDDPDPPETEVLEPEGDEPEPEGEIESEPGDDDPEPRRPTARQPRENATVRDLRARSQESERRVAEMERLLVALRNTPAQPSPAEQLRQQQEEQERLSLMQPHEVAQYFATRSEQRLTQQLQVIRRENAEANDRVAFEALQARDPIAKRFSADVEKVVAEQAAQGMTVRRELALNFVVGKAVRDRAVAAAAKQKPRGAARVAGQTVAAGGRAGGDTPSERGNRAGGLDALEARLANVKF